MARTAGAKNTKPQIDPLIAALIARLPKAGAVWPANKRQAWLGMMESAFDEVYELPSGGGMADQTNRNTPHGVANGLNGHTAPPKPEEHAFYIDKQGYARINGGERINANMVDGILFDQRGEGDLGAIIWADDTRGVLGKVLDIRPA